MDPFVLLTILLIAPTTGPTAGPTTAPNTPVWIERAEPTSQRIAFARNRIPAGMPKITANEAAITVSNYQCDASVSYSIVEQHQSKDGWHVTAKVHQVHLKLTLADTIYLPPIAPVELRAHEEGHRVMNERIYQEGEPQAESAAADVLSHDWQGVGVNADAAATAATDAAIHHLDDLYMTATAERSSRLGDIYDRLTSHGRNHLLVANAIRLAFLEEKNAASTQP